MSENVLESYLVKLGFSTDGPSLRQFNQALAQAQGSVGKSVASSVVALAKLDEAVITTFASVVSGIVAVADKTAMSDQQFRLMGERMMLTTNNARALQTSLDILGVSLDEAVYDPELNHRLNQMVGHFQKLEQVLGPDFEQNMKGIRNFRTLFKEFGKDVEALGAASISDLYTKLGLGNEGGLQQKLEKLEDWFFTNIPQMADKVSTYLTPVLRDGEEVLAVFAKDAGVAGAAFTTIIGALSGDEGIQGATFDLDKFGRALIHIADAATEFSLAVSTAFRVVGHAVMTNVYGAEQLWAAIKGDMAGASKYNALANAEASALANDVTDRSTAADFKDWGTFQRNQSLRGTGETSLWAIINRAAKANGMDPALLAAVIKTESNGNPNAKSKAGALGLMQLMPDTAEELGVNPLNPEENINAGSLYLEKLIKRYKGNLKMALAAYNWGAGNVEKYGMGALPDETRSFIDRVGRLTAQGEATGGDVIIHGMTINVPAGASPHETKQAVTDAMRDAMASHRQVLISQVAGGPY